MTEWNPEPGRIICRHNAGMDKSEWLAEMTNPRDPDNPGFIEPETLVWMESTFAERGPISKQDLEDLYLQTCLQRAREALVLVQADLGPRETPSDEVRIELDDEGCMLLVYGGWTSLDTHVDLLNATAVVADAVQDLEMDERWEAYPLCPQHNLGLHPEVRGNRAAWWCTVDGHAVADIGRLRHPD